MGDPVTEKDFVEPGTVLAHSEELLPGEGTYDDGEMIRAAVYGTQKTDPETMEISVVPAGKTVATIEKGDIVIGQIRYIKPDLASVNVLAVRGKEERSILQQVEATLRVRNADNQYVSELGDIYKIGDIIRAKVISTKGGPQLATDKSDLGVVKGFSKLDPTMALESDGRRLLDPERGHAEQRKVAIDYGSGEV